MEFTISCVPLFVNRGAAIVYYGLCDSDLIKNMILPGKKNVEKN